MKSFRQFISEGKQVGIVYHYTTVDILSRILADDSLRGGGNGISVTRDQNFHKHYRIGMKGRQCRLELDGDEISNRYKVRPYNDFSEYHSDAEPYRHKESHDEQEELIKTSDLKNVSSYILGISFFRMPTNAMVATLDDRGIPYTVMTKFIKDLEDKWSKYRRANDEDV